MLYISNAEIEKRCNRGCLGNIQEAQQSKKKFSKRIERKCEVRETLSSEGVAKGSQMR
jgi:hypothetical protein